MSYNYQFDPWRWLLHLIYISTAKWVLSLRGFNFLLLFMGDNPLNIWAHETVTRWHMAIMPCARGWLGEPWGQKYNANSLIQLSVLNLGPKDQFSPQAQAQ